MQFKGKRRIISTPSTNPPPLNAPPWTVNKSYKPSSNSPAVNEQSTSSSNDEIFQHAAGRTPTQQVRMPHVSSNNRSSVRGQISQSQSANSNHFTPLHSKLTPNSHKAKTTPRIPISSANHNTTRRIISQSPVTATRRNSKDRTPHREILNIERVKEKLS